jgi:anti-sigma B factor antagonist
MTSQQLRSQPKMEHVDDADMITFTDGKIGGEENFIARELDGLTLGLNHRHLFLDFSNVGYINSSELGTLITLHKNMKADGGRLTLVNVSPHIGEVLERTKLSELFEVRKEGPKREVNCSWLEAIPYPDNG